MVKQRADTIPIRVSLQPKQSKLLDLVKYSSYTRIGYGGSNGGGKSDGIRSVNLILCTEPKPAPIKTLIFRRRSNDLLENHINPFFQRYPQLKKLFNKTERIIYWTDGSTTKFGSADNEDDVEDFEGKEYDYEFIDEATHCSQKMIEFLQTRNRSANVKAKMIFTMIPGFVGHNYIKRLFITKQYKQYEDGDAYTYLPARVWDNVVWVEDQLGRDNIPISDYYSVWTEEQRREYTLRHSDYAKVLAHLPEQKMKARLFGDWFIFEGQFFEEFNPDVHVIQPKDYLSYDIIKSHYKILGSMDYGNDTFVYYAYADYNGNVVFIDEWYDVKSTRGVKIRSLKKFIDERGLNDVLIKADTNLWIKDAFDVEDSKTSADEFLAAGIKIDKISKLSTDQRGFRIQCNDAVKDALHFERSESGIITKQPKIKIYARCAKLIETLPELITDEKNIEDIEDGQYDHPYDSAKYLYISIPKTPELKKDQLPAHLRKKLNKYKNPSTMSE